MLRKGRKRKTGREENKDRFIPASDSVDFLRPLRWGKANTEHLSSGGSVGWGGGSCRVLLHGNARSGALDGASANRQSKHVCPDFFLLVFKLHFLGDNATASSKGFTPQDTRPLLFDWTQRRNLIPRSWRENGREKGGVDEYLTSVSPFFLLLQVAETWGVTCPWGFRSSQISTRSSAPENCG